MKPVPPVPEQPPAASTGPLTARRNARRLAASYPQAASDVIADLAGRSVRRTPVLFDRQRRLVHVGYDACEHPELTRRLVRGELQAFTILERLGPDDRGLGSMRYLLKEGSCPEGWAAAHLEAQRLVAWMNATGLQDGPAERPPFLECRRTRTV